MKCGVGYWGIATLAALLWGIGSAQAAPILSKSGAFKLTQVVSGLRLPVTLVNAGDGSNRLFVLEQYGKIKIIKDGQVLAKPFLNISDKVPQEGTKITSNETGLLGLVFHPNYASNRKFYIYYTDLKRHIRLCEYLVSEADPDVADKTSERVFIDVDHSEFGNHFGGDIFFLLLTVPCSSAVPMVAGWATLRARLRT